MRVSYSTRTREARFWVEDELVLAMDDISFDEFVTLNEGIGRAFSKGIIKGFKSAEQMTGNFPGG